MTNPQQIEVGLIEFGRPRKMSSFVVDCSFVICDVKGQ